MKKVVAWLLVLTLTAAISIGATLAYLMDTDEDVNVMTLGKVKIEQLEYERIDTETTDADATVQEFHDHKPLYPAVTDKDFDYTPGDTYVDWDQIGKDGYTSEIWNPEKINNEVDKMVFVKNKGDYDAYVRSVFAFEAGNYKTLDEFKQMVHLNLNETDYTWEWTETPVTIGESTYFVATATYNKVLEPGALTEISLSQISLDKTATNEDVKAFGETYQVLVKSQGIQADGFDDPDFALNEGFGVIDANNVPWESDAPEQGATVYNALHYLGADTTTAAITAKVNSVTFGLNKDYASIVDNYDGTLVTAEQDVPVHAYYVPNGSNYDVYLLANDVVYAPKDSTGLFRGMSNMASLNSGNLDFSRMEKGRYLFRSCSKLTTIDATGWDFSNCTDLGYLFYQCGALSEIKGITNWDMSKNTSLEAAFYNVHSLKELDLSGWKLGSLKSAKWAFANNNNMERINATGWDLESLETSDYMFRVNPKLQVVEGSGGWYMPNNTSAYAMFYNNPAMTVIDATSWDFSSCTKIHDLFCANTSLKTVTGIGNWNTGNITNMISVFNGCIALEELDDLSGWDVSQVTDMGFMFYDCRALKELNGIGAWETESLEYLQAMFKGAKTLTTLDIGNWDVSGVKTFNSLFSATSQNTGNMKLTNLDLSKWDTSSATTMGWMFYGCGSLTEVNLSDQAMPNLTTVSHMFADCYKLENIVLDNWQTPALTCLDGMFNNCEAMKTVDLSSFSTGKVREFSQMFEACYSLEKVIGLENFDTSSGHDFSEMFSGCRSLKELDLSTFDTRLADPAYWTYANCENWVFLRFMSGCSSLEKVTFGPYFSFDGKGNCPDSYKFAMPAATGVAGWDGNWYDANGNAYAPSEIPEETAGTYYAVNPVNP